MTHRCLTKSQRFTIYQLEAQYPKSKDKYYSERWTTRSMHPEWFGERHPRHNEDWKKIAPLYREYGASGECWQKYGLEGFIDYDLAAEAFKAVMMNFKADFADRIIAWRLVSRRIDVYIEDIADFKVKREENAAS